MTKKKIKWMIRNFHIGRKTADEIEKSECVKLITPTGDIDIAGATPKDYVRCRFWDGNEIRFYIDRTEDDFRRLRDDDTIYLKDEEFLSLWDEEKDCEKEFALTDEEIDERINKSLYGGI